MAAPQGRRGRRHVTEEQPRPAIHLVAGALAVNGLLLVGFGVAFWLTRSQLVLAQGADSLMDIATGVILTISTRVGSQPSDARHPFGHQRAEPIGALVTAVLAGVLAVEVARSAIGALWLGETPASGGIAAAALGVKFGIKLILLALLASRLKKAKSAALDATRVDTRNDVMATGASLAGLALAVFGLGWLDGALAVVVAGYIGWSGMDLARENLRYLMGEAPTEEVLRELRALAEGVHHVDGVVALRAHYVGHSLHVDATVLVRSGLDATQSHDLAVDVTQALENHHLVELAFVHCDTAHGKDHAPPSG